MIKPSEATTPRNFVMDEFIDQFFSSSSWTDEKAPGRTSWADNGLVQTNGLLPSTMAVYEGDEKILPTNLPPCHIVDSLINEDASMFVGEDSSFDLDKTLIREQSKPLQGGTDPKPGYMDQHSNPPSTLSTLNYGSPELPLVAIDPAMSPSLQPESGSVGSNESELSEIQPTLRVSNSLNSVPHLWPPSSYRGVSSLPSVLMQDKLQGLGFNGEYVEADAAILGNNNFKDDNILQGNLPALLSVNGQYELNKNYVSSLADRYHVPLGRTAEIHPQMQFSQMNEGNPIKHYRDQSPISQQTHALATTVGGCNGAVKPRVRARRGQATDPHSIAERLRREKIAERMKNLQELVPSSNKTDKASMLDEIIEYVKFLQLQVKVLSMSRLGAAGAVVPLITDSQAEGSSCLLSELAARGGDHPLESPNDLAFEQEVIKLMESNMTTAIQFLQTKGLCLMPIALAAAISGSKGSSSIPADRKKPVFTNGHVHHSNGCNGAVIKQEDVMNTANNTTEMNPDEA